MVADYPLILLAGGKSSRMAVPKGLLPFRGRPWVIEQLERFQRAGGERAAVVLGYSADRYFETVPLLGATAKSWGTHNGLQVRTLVNTDAEWGPFSTILTGARFLMSEGAKAVYVLPIDIPVPSIQVWQELSSSLQDETLAAVPEYLGRGGHPVLLKDHFLQKLFSLPLAAEDSRLDLQLRQLPLASIARVKVDDPGVCKDLNTPAEWKQFESS
jgi:CTP:molybdopterin cytidylyltransferase MocA